MKKETVIRQNRCDQEMAFLLFGCFALFAAVLLLTQDPQQPLLRDRTVRTLCLTAAPGFAFLMGYCFERSARLKTEKSARQSVLTGAAGCFLLFLFLAAGEAVPVQRMPVKSSIADIITAVLVPSVSSVFFSLSLLLLLVWIFYGTVRKLAAHRKLALAAGTAVLLCAFARSEADSYAVMAALFGQKTLISVPAVPYFAYFLLGIWCEEKKPGFSLKLAGISAAVTVLSVLCYRTFFQSLCLVTISALPVYLVYAAAEGLSELTLRVRAAKWICERSKAAFLLYAAVLPVTASRKMFAGASVWTLLLAGLILLLLVYAGVLCCGLLVKAYAVWNDYFYHKAKHKTAVYFVVYTFAFSFLLFLVFFEFLRSGRTFIIKGDGVAQYFPRIIYFSRYIRKLISSLLSGSPSLPMYDFRMGLGSEVTYSLEPLYFLFALFKEEHLEFAYNLVTVLRFYLAGAAVSVLCLYFRKGYFETFLASAVYVFCGFALYGGAMHTMFMIPMIMLPLLIVAVEEILRGRRWYLCTVFAAVSLFSNYYYLYMNTLAMGIYFLVRFFGSRKGEERSFRKFISRALAVSGSYLLGIAMSCIVLVTTFGMYLGSGRGGGIQIKTPSLFFYHAKWMVGCFMTFLTTANSPGEWLKLGYLPIAFFAVILLLRREGRRELKILTALAVIFMAFPAAGFIFSGFSAVINRWCYMISLLVAYLVAECYRDMRSMDRKDLCFCGLATCVYGFLAYFGTYKTTRYTRYAFLMLAVMFIVLLLCQYKEKYLSEASKKGLLLAVTAVFVFYQGYSLYHMDGRVRGYTEPQEALQEVKDTPLRAVSQLGDESFYRCSALQPSYNSYNASYLLDFNSTTLLCSTLNGSIMEYLEQMGCTSYSMIKMTGLNNRAMLSSPAAVKYFACYDTPGKPLPYGSEEVLNTEVDGRSVTVWENPYALPLGYTYSNTISAQELEQYPVQERQEVLLQRVLLSREDSEIQSNTNAEKEHEIEITSQKLEITEKKENGISLKEDAMTAKGEKTDEETDSVTLTFESLPESELYFVLHHAALEGDMSETPIKITLLAGGTKTSYDFRPDDYRYHSGQQDYVFHLGYFEEPVDSCEIQMDRAGTITFDSYALYSQPMKNLEKYTEALTEEILEKVEIADNCVSGTISVSQDKILTLSIPYQKGWKAYVDGEETELLRANYMYLAVPLAKGEHTVELRFEIPGVSAALMIMAGAAVLFLILCTAGAVRRRKKKNG